MELREILDNEVAIDSVLKLTTSGSPEQLVNDYRQAMKILTDMAISRLATLIGQEEWELREAFHEFQLARRGGRV